MRLKGDDSGLERPITPSVCYSNAPEPTSPLVRYPTLKSFV